MQLTGWFRYLTTFTVGGAITLLGGWDRPLQILLTLIVVDYVSGLLAAWTAGRVSSSIGARGIAKKVGYLLLLIVANVADGYLLHGAPGARIVVMTLLSGNEFWSVCENLTALGVPIPKVIRNALEVARKDDAA